MTLSDRDAAASRIIELLRSGGGTLYLGEAVTQLEHALQTAALAESARAPAPLVAAALLHDIGHVVHDHADTLSHEAVEAVDAHHEELGHLWLSDHFGPAVTEPVRLHVAAKRFLYATDPSYLRTLSSASLASLALQGGAMSPREVEAFRFDPWAQAAIRLRLWDDAAKVPGLDVPPLEHYQPLLLALLET